MPTRTEQHDVYFSLDEGRRGKLVELFIGEPTL